MASSFVLTAGPLSALIVPMCESWQGFVGYIGLDLDLPLFTLQRCGSGEPTESPVAPWEGYLEASNRFPVLTVLSALHFPFWNRAETVEQESQNFERKVGSQAVQV